MTPIRRSNAWVGDGEGRYTPNPAAAACSAWIAKGACCGAGGCQLGEMGAACQSSQGLACMILRSPSVVVKNSSSIAKVSSSSAW